MLCSNWKPVHPSCKARRYLCSVEQCNVELDGSCSSSSSLSKAGRAREKLTGSQSHERDRRVGASRGRGGAQGLMMKLFQHCPQSLCQCLSRFSKSSYPQEQAVFTNDPKNCCQIVVDKEQRERKKRRQLGTNTCLPKRAVVLPT